MATKDPVAEFAALDEEFRRLHEQGLIEGGKTEEGRGKGKPVKVRADAARKEKFSKKSIRLAEESATFTNAIVASLSDETPGIVKASARELLRHYPTLTGYFKAAARFSDAASSPPQTGAPSAPDAPVPAPAEGPSPTEASAATEAMLTTEGGDQAAGAASAQGLFLVGEVFKRWACGWYTNPKPARAADRVCFTGVLDPKAELLAKGYHHSGFFMENDWTRSQTWWAWPCGLWTFRDHGTIIDGTTYKEQRYVGWSPPGEPNPEVYLSGPWPYWDWPAYVYWWHEWGPGGK